MPVFTALIAATLGQERITWWKVLSRLRLIQAVYPNAEHLQTTDLCYVGSLTDIALNYAWI